MNRTGEQMGLPDNKEPSGQAGLPDNKGSSGQGNHSAREIVMTRLIDAPRELVFRAWTDPDHLAQWWGPKGFTNTFHEFDLRPGGFWRFIMHGPDGTDYNNTSTFVEIVKPDRIVFDHLRPVHGFRVTAIFTGSAGKTELTWSMLFETVAECDRVRGFIIEANNQNLDRLEAHIATGMKGLRDAG